MWALRGPIICATQEIQLQVQFCVCVHADDVIWSKMRRSARKEMLVFYPELRVHEIASYVLSLGIKVLW